MKAIELTATPRDGDGKGAARKLRTTGKLPAVLYGAGIDSRSLTVDRHELVRLLKHHGAHALVALKVDGDQEYLALVKDVQIDPVRWEALHVDFVRVEENKPVTTEASIVLEGEPAGVKLGGVLEFHMRTVQIAALPRQIPEHISVDVSGLDIGDILRIGDLEAPEGVTLLTDPEETLVTVAQPKLEVEPTPAEPEEGAVAEGEAAPETQGEGASGEGT